MYAIVRTGGHQYKVAVGDQLDVEKLPVEAGEQVELNEVLMVSSDDQVTVGDPLVAGARVTATVVDQHRGNKIIVFKYKPKKRYRRKMGHRQDLTRLSINAITL
ncbi:MAG TPA: 50S ribosomal protein L21 [Chloroflexia bacterium]